jgi:hypothetical protein
MEGGGERRGRKKLWDDSWTEQLHCYMCWIKQTMLVIQIHMQKLNCLWLFSFLNSSGIFHMLWQNVWQTAYNWIFYVWQVTLWIYFDVYNQMGIGQTNVGGGFTVYQFHMNCFSSGFKVECQNKKCYSFNSPLSTGSQTMVLNSLEVCEIFWEICQEAV